ncbi:MAG: response regulator transcription factor [Saprospiraceae bacterium]|nr:response regulator transcription factor [Saprospiraceae bacterium]
MNKIKIIIADDQLLFLKGLRLLINTFENMTLIGEANNGQELLNIMQVDPPDVVLLDLKMPVMDGIQATKHIKEDFPDVKIILLSMYNDESIINLIMSLGANSYLLKNEDPSVLKIAIESVMDKGFYFNEYTSKALLHGLKDPAVRKGKSKLLDAIQLTKREIEVLELICQEYTSNEIAKKLFLSVRTVEGHRKSLLEKTDARNIAGLVLYAMKNQLIQI